MAATESSSRAMSALDDLYRRHVGDVYRYTYAVLGNHADAEDVTQTTFVNALRALERGEIPREPSRWLLTISHNLVRQRWRQAAARPVTVELVNDVPDETPEDDVRLDELVQALQRIPTNQREALVMRELEGRSYKEIAELLALSTSALETLLFRARRSLAEELENLVTCQTAEQALSRESDGRLSRKARKRLDAHVADCPSCARFSRSQAQQRKAFKGLAMLPLPVGLALFRETPVAAASTLTAVGGEAGTTAGTGVGTGGAAAGGGAAGGSVTVGGTVAGGSLLGGAAVKVAAVVAAVSVAAGVGYQGVSTLRTESPSVASAAVAGASRTESAERATTSDEPPSSTVAGESPGVPVLRPPGGATFGPSDVLPAHADGADASTHTLSPSNGHTTSAGGGTRSGRIPGQRARIRRRAGPRQRECSRRRAWRQRPCRRRQPDDTHWWWWRRR